MILWAILGLVLLTLGVSMWTLMRILSTSRRQTQMDAWAVAQYERFAALADPLLRVEHSLEHANQRLATMWAHLTKPPEENPMVGLSFLPTDESTADIERQLRTAEDRSIGAAASTRFSSQRLQKSAKPSGRGASTPAGNHS